MHGNKVVLDLEFTPVMDPDLQTVAASEIIEIGAVKLDAENQFLEEFQTYVKPAYSKIPQYVTKITGICETTINDAPDYETAMVQFMSWIGISPCRFYTWSTADQYVLQREADLKEFPLTPMFYTHWIDLQRIHQRLYHFKKPMNLAIALGSMQIYFQGTEHGALADARNTAEALRRMSNIRGVLEQIAVSHITYNDAEEHGFPMTMVFKKKSTVGRK